MKTNCKLIPFCIKYLLVSMDVWADVAILLMYGFHDIRYIGFHRLTVVNGPPSFGASPTEAHHKHKKKDKIKK